MIGGGERKLIERLVGHGIRTGWRSASQLYLDHYTRHNGELTRLYPGVAETLALPIREKVGGPVQQTPAPDPAGSGGYRHRPVFRRHPGGSGKGLPLKPEPDAPPVPDRRSGGGTLPQPHGGG